MRNYIIIIISSGFAGECNRSLSSFENKDVVVIVGSPEKRRRCEGVEEDSGGHFRWNFWRESEWVGY